MSCSPNDLQNLYLEYDKGILSCEQANVTYVACCQLLNMFSLDYEAVLKIMRYAMQPPIYQETLEEITDIYGNLSFLGPYQNVTHVTKLTNKLMKTDFNARILMCRYAGVPSTLNPSNCNIFQRSLTNEGLGYSFNHANFWDIFAETPYTKLYSQIMMPKGYKEAPTPSDKEVEDENQRWIYPQKGILFPDSSGPAYGLLAILQVRGHIFYPVYLQMNLHIFNEKFECDIFDVFLTL